MIKIKQYYKNEKSDVCEYIINNKSLEDHSEIEINEILDRILNINYLQNYVQNLFWRFNPNQVGESYTCSCCGTLCETYRATIDEISIEYSTHCFEDGVSWDCSDEEMIKILRNKIPIVDLFKNAVGYGYDDFSGYAEDLSCELIYY